jgi:ribosomal protein S6--L-glutamate ligase
MSAGARRLLVLGPDQGWHAEQLRRAATRHGRVLCFADYESLAAGVGPVEPRVALTSSAGRLDDAGYEAILTRTMPAASMERITFRLAVLHAIADGCWADAPRVVNPPRALEWAIDKFASLVRLAQLGLPTPATRLVQSRAEALEAFAELGGDCVLKPLFGGEGRGVMRITDPQLAWYSFSTLDRLDSVLQIQQFVPPGGRDLRLLVLGERVLAVRRRNQADFRTNVAAGAVVEPARVDNVMIDTARRIMKHFGLVIASIDLLEREHGPPVFLEVNAVPGWKGAQSVVDPPIAEWMLEAVTATDLQVTP